ncbi:glycosyltransferase [Arthrobacter sp. ISL-72]|uniref:glycosyltransferase n=1 Tax=Arthrobacter sp. ISL-72 TaxID=2819114 RepID=UPI00203654D5|nr:glycosyltransferase [Arthrobacter sp. ISL-72]
MRIGLIAPPWITVPPPAYGGIEAVVDVLARGLTAAGHEVLLATAAGSTCPVPQVPGAMAGDPARMGMCADELRHSVFAYEAMDGVDLVHDHTLAGPLYRHGTDQRPIIATAHGPRPTAHGPRPTHRRAARGLPGDSRRLLTHCHFPPPGPLRPRPEDQPGHPPRHRHRYGSHRERRRGLRMLSGPHAPRQGPDLGHRGRTDGPDAAEDRGENAQW